MRDSTITESFMKMERMVGSDIRLLNKTIATLAMRMDAMQKVIFGGRFSFIYALILSIFAPKMLERNISRIHQQIELDYQKKIREQTEEMRKAVIKPGEDNGGRFMNGVKHEALLLLLVLFSLLGSGCAFRSEVKKAELAGYKNADVECMKIQGQYQNYIRTLEVDLASKTERLRKFQQVDAEGKLITKSEGK